LTKPLPLTGLLLGGFVVAFQPFLNKPHFYRFGRYPYPGYLAIDNGVNLLDIRLELSSGDANNLATDAAQLLGLTTTGNLIAEGYSLARIMTFS